MTNVLSNDAALAHAREIFRIIELFDGDKNRALDAVKTQVQIIDCDGYIRALEERITATKRE